MLRGNGDRGVPGKTLSTSPAKTTISHRRLLSFLSSLRFPLLGFHSCAKIPALGRVGGEGTALQNKAGIKYSQPQSGLSLSISWDRGRGSSGNFHGIGAPMHRWAQRPVPFHQENPGNLCTKREGGTGTTQGGFSIVFSKLILGVGGRDRQSSLTSVCFACWGLENRASPPTELQVLSLTSISSFSVAKQKARS